MRKCERNTLSDLLRLVGEGGQMECDQMKCAVLCRSVPVHTSIYQYAPVCTSMYWYVPFRKECTDLYCPVPSCTYRTSGNFLLSCTVRYRPVIVRKIWYLLVPSCTVLYPYRKSGTDVYRLVQSCANLENPVLTCTVLFQNQNILY
jgi:hypothetical protein